MSAEVMGSTTSGSASRPSEWNAGWTAPVSKLRQRYQQGAYWLSVGRDCVRGRASESVYVLGYVKSGTTWLCYLLSSVLGIPLLETPKQSWPRRRGPCVFHVHRFIPLHSVRQRTVYVLRDGRDALVSFYFHIVRESEQPIKRRMERKLGCEMTADNIRENLPQFIDFMQGNRTHSIDYRAHVEEWRRRQETYVTLRYEDLLKDTVAELSRVVFEVTGREPSAELVRGAVARHDFTRLTGRQRGVHDPSSFLRKGVEGDWRNHFSPEAARLYDAYAGDLLIELGYETSRSWVSATT